HEDDDDLPAGGVGPDDLEVLVDEQAREPDREAGDEDADDEAHAAILSSPADDHRGTSRSDDGAARTVRSRTWAAAGKTRRRSRTGGLSDASARSAHRRRMLA